MLAEYSDIRFDVNLDKLKQHPPQKGTSSRSGERIRVRVEVVAEGKERNEGRGGKAGILFLTSVSLVVLSLQAQLAFFAFPMTHPTIPIGR